MNINKKLPIIDLKRSKVVDGDLVGMPQQIVKSSSITLDEKVVIINKYKVPANQQINAIYMGRGSPFGNPYHVDYHGRDGACDKFDEYMEKQLASDKPNTLKTNLYRLVEHVKKSQEPVMLMCFCAPKRCHVESIKRFIIEQIEVTYDS